MTTTETITIRKTRKGAESYILNTLRFPINEWVSDLQYWNGSSWVQIQVRFIIVSVPGPTHRVVREVKEF